MLVLFLAVIAINSTKTLVINDHLVEQWQSLIQGQLISANYLNRLMTLTAGTNFALIVPSYYSVLCVQNTNSFPQAITQLSEQIHSALIGAHRDLNRVHTGVKRVPKHLQTISIPVKNQTNVGGISINFARSAIASSAKFARLALKQYEDFLHRDQHRQSNYETFLIKTSNK